MFEGNSLRYNSTRRFQLRRRNLLTLSAVPMLAAVHPPVVLKASAVMALRESRPKTFAAMLAAGHAAEAVAADDPADRLVDMCCRPVLP